MSHIRLSEVDKRGGDSFESLLWPSGPQAPVRPGSDYPFGTDLLIDSGFAVGVFSRKSRSFVVRSAGIRPAMACVHDKTRCVQNKTRVSGEAGADGVDRRGGESS